MHLLLLQGGSVLAISKKKATHMSMILLMRIILLISTNDPFIFLFRATQIRQVLHISTNDRAKHAITLNQRRRRKRRSKMVQ